jgi:hypothetical protein
MSAPTQTTDGYAFEGGFPTRATVRRAYDAADLNRAVKAYRFFFPTVSGLAIFKGNAAVGVVPNRVFARFATEPEQMGFTLNSDTPYGADPAGPAGRADGDGVAPWPADLCRVRPEPAVVADMGDAGADAPAELWFGPQAPRGRRAAGSRRSRAGAGSCTSASTGRSNRPSTAPGSSPTSRSPDG